MLHHFIIVVFLTFVEKKKEAAWAEFCKTCYLSLVANASKALTL